MQLKADRYYPFSRFLKERFGFRVQRISIDGGFSCPNIDGTKGVGGCVYCDNKAFSPGIKNRAKPVGSQIEEAIGYLKKRFRKTKGYLAYFQPYSNTHAPVERLEEVYREALEHPEVMGLIVGTRPDCISEEAIDLLEKIAEEGNYVQIELGLQSANEKTLERINRCHTAGEFTETFNRIEKRKGLDVCVHVILGLPGEDREDMLRTADFLAELNYDGLKIHVLHVVRGTRLEKDFDEGKIKLLEQEEYVSIVCDFLERTPENVTIQRLTADAPPDIHLGPAWAMEKNQVIEAIKAELLKRDTRQGKKVTTEER